MTATTTDLSATDIAAAYNLDCARLAWTGEAFKRDRAPFGRFAAAFLRERGLEVQPAPPPPTCPPPLTLAEVFNGAPHLLRAAAMPIEEIADLLAALDEHDLTWTPGTRGHAGTLHHGPPEPDDRHVVFDGFGWAWQRDDARAENDPLRRWFRSVGCGDGATWDELHRDLGPITPNGGITPPQDQQ